MELAKPDAPMSDTFAVTNGLLFTELVSGKIQTGADTFEDRGSGAEIPISGDYSDATAPTYKDLRTISSIQGDNQAPDQTGKPISQSFDKAQGLQGSLPAGVPPIENVQYISDTHHNIPSVFWDFLNMKGSIVVNGQIVQGQVNDPWFYASGLPITEAAWMKLKKGGEYRWVPFQGYQRRGLTYDPQNPPGFQVEMGNIGQHYYDWKYRSVGVVTSTPTPTPPTTTPTAQPTAQAGNGPQPPVGYITKKYTRETGTHYSESWFGGSEFAIKKGDANTFVEFTDTQNGPELYFQQWIKAIAFQKYGSSGQEQVNQVLAELRANHGKISVIFPKSLGTSRVGGNSIIREGTPVEVDFSKPIRQIVSNDLPAGAQEIHNGSTSAWIAYGVINGQLVMVQSPRDGLYSLDRGAGDFAFGTETYLEFVAQIHRASEFHDDPHNREDNYMYAISHMVNDIDSANAKFGTPATDRRAFWTWNGNGGYSASMFTFRWHSDRGGSGAQLCQLPRLSPLDQ